MKWNKQMKILKLVRYLDHLLHINVHLTSVMRSLKLLVCHGHSQSLCFSPVKFERNDSIVSLPITADFLSKTDFTVLYLCSAKVIHTCRSYFTAITPCTVYPHLLSSGAIHLALLFVLLKRPKWLKTSPRQAMLSYSKWPLLWRSFLQYV